MFFLAGCFLPLGLLFFSKFSYIKFIVREPDFPEEWLMVLKMVKWTKNGSKTCFSWIYWKDWSWIFTEFVLFGMLLHKFHIWENYSFSDMGQNVLRQSFWMNFSLIMSLEQIYETELEISLLWVFAWCEKPLSCRSHSCTLWKNFFGSKNLGDWPKAGIFEFIDNVSTW